MTEFKVGDTVAATKSYLGLLTKDKQYSVVDIGKTGWVRVVCDDGNEDGFHLSGDWFRLVPTGPVVTETVTKTRIVPGTYDGVNVGDASRHGVSLAIESGYYTADELDAAAAVLSALAKGLRDA